MIQCETRGSILSTKKKEEKEEKKGGRKEGNRKRIEAKPLWRAVWSLLWTVIPILGLQGTSRLLAPTLHSTSVKKSSLENISDWTKLKHPDAHKAKLETMTYTCVCASIYLHVSLSVCVCVFTYVTTELFSKELLSGAHAGGMIKL